MRVAIVSCVFPPEPVMSAQTSLDLAAEMTRRGHEVVVFTSFPNRPSGVLLGGTRRRWVHEERLNGFRLVRSWHFLSEKSAVGSRLMENLSFGITSSWRLLTEGKFDVAYLNTWPLLSQWFSIMALRCRKVPIVCAVQDIYPESLTNKGRIPQDGIAARWMRRLDTWNLKKCSVVSTLSLGMREFLVADRGVHSDSVVYIPNWSSGDSFPPGLPKEGPFRKKLGLPPEMFVALFAGSLTMSAGVEMYVETANILARSGRRNITILLVGDGSTRKTVETKIHAAGLSNIRVVYPLEVEQVPEVQAAADVLLLSLAAKSTQNAAPSKQVSYMFSGKPVVASVSEDSPAADLIRQSNSGFIVPPDDPEAVASLLCELAEDVSKIGSLGENGREYAMAHFSKEQVLPGLARILEMAGPGCQ